MQLLNWDITNVSDEVSKAVRKKPVYPDALTDDKLSLLRSVT